MFINLTNIDFCPCNSDIIIGGEGDIILQRGKSVTYSANGNYNIIPDTGYDGFASVGVTVDVPESTTNLQSISKTYTSNGNYTISPDEGYDGLSSVGITVNVPTTSGTDLTSYRYRYNTGNYDINGLKALGWGDDSIAYYVFNESHTPDQDSKYIVTDGNKALYREVNSSNIRLYRDNANFVYCPSFITIGITSMWEMFRACKFLKSIPIINTFRVTDMGSMFKYCSSLQTIPQLDTSNVTDMNNMFMGCYDLQAVPPLDTSKVTNMSGMFYACSSLQTIPQLDTSNVTNMDGMFYKCKSLQTISLLNMSRVSSALQTFDECSSLKYLRLTGSLNTNLDISYTTLLDYGSVKSILTAASNTTNTNSKTLKFNSTLTDQNGELASLVSTCTGKGWTVSGLTLN